jgi:hypothetical protein
MFFAPFSLLSRFPPLIPGKPVPCRPVRVSGLVPDARPVQPRTADAGAPGPFGPSPGCRFAEVPAAGRGKFWMCSRSEIGRPVNGRSGSWVFSLESSTAARKVRCWSVRGRMHRLIDVPWPGRGRAYSRLATMIQHSVRSTAPRPSGAAHEDAHPQFTTGRGCRYCAGVTDHSSVVAVAGQRCRGYPRASRLGPHGTTLDNDSHHL